MSLLGSSGSKSRWAREIDTNDPEDVLGITNTQASVFTAIHGLAVEDNSGVKHIKIDAIAESGFNLTDYANLEAGSTILRVGAGITPTLYVKVLSSTTPAYTDWFYIAGTVAPANAVS